eukprot:CAMPEP_0119353718 /NCGR_PEP_ID=MMETSP1334-20130426/2832_1 /TAXON_ID=127549 /ORGANISM="Calcidiscus leptoporus, Strain RCC1130" /LENGTH=143 /DNA_ID=CAMNT_0007367077 /DNA_START=361 /DNA_END=792 /DNA_ORIENTATION=-
MCALLLLLLDPCADAQAREGEGEQAPNQHGAAKAGAEVAVKGESTEVFRTVEAVGRLIERVKRATLVGAGQLRDVVNPRNEIERPREQAGEGSAAFEGALSSDRLDQHARHEQEEEAKEREAEVDHCHDDALVSGDRRLRLRS